MEIEVDEGIMNTPLAAEIRSQLEAWMASRCPDHLGAFMKLSKN
jgi:hypothetical protein